MADIFLSYTRSDFAVAGRLARILSERGWSVFWDRTVPAGKSWRDQIGSALDAASVIVVLWSSASSRSQWVVDEADEGRRRGILVPAIIDQTRPPLGFRQLQAADLSESHIEPSDPNLVKFIDDVEAMLHASEKLTESPNFPVPGQPYVHSTGERASNRFPTRVMLLAIILGASAMLSWWFLVPHDLRLPASAGRLSEGANSSHASDTSVATVRAPPVEPASASSPVPSASVPIVRRAQDGPIASQQVGDDSKNLWIGARLYGADNEVAAVMPVRITRSTTGHLVHITNQFGFTCNLRFDKWGNPSELSGCASKSKPEWTVREPRIQLRCSTHGTEVVCSGRYNLVSDSYAQPSTLTIARRLTQ